MTDLEMTIGRHDVWTDTIFDAHVPGVDNRAILDFYEETQSKEQGIIRSNVGGWQFDVGYNMCPALDDMFDKVVYAVNHIFHNVLKIDEEVVLANAWLNSNQYGNKNSLHTHPGSIFSGVYYINGNGDEENGQINFCRADAHSIESTLIMSDKLREYSSSERDKSWRVAASLPAVESHALLFAPWMVHEVTRNFQYFDRVVVGLNFTHAPHEQT